MAKEASAMKRVFIFGGCWFLFWMALCAVIGWLRSPPNAVFEGVYSGIFNGAWLALLTAFAWPWIMPRTINRWMDRPEA
jgi:hypothetical protein